MRGLSPHDYAKQNAENLDARASLYSLYIVLPEQFDAGGEMHLQRLLQCQNGDCMKVEIFITLAQNHSVKAGDMTGIIRNSCEGYFEYALGTSHDKTVIGHLYEEDGKEVGDFEATFRRLDIPSLRCGAI